MKEYYYTNDENVRILISLLKQYGIRRVIASPGTVNIPLVASLQQDKDFMIYSSVDERSAAYMACGMAAESGEPVVITCTGATASRNYVPGLTEAYYRKLPVIAITCCVNMHNIGHLYPQMLDRRQIQNDIAKFSVQVNLIRDNDDRWATVINLNKAFINVKRHGYGPVHINLETSGGVIFNADRYTYKSLPDVKRISFYTVENELPQLPEGNICVFVGSHLPFSDVETDILDNFCLSNNAVVVCDHTSNYRGKYRFQSSLIGQQKNDVVKGLFPDLTIHIGEVSGDYSGLDFIRQSKEVWRVNEDGELRDYFRKLSSVFEMTESSFFSHYISPNKKGNSYFAKIKAYSDELLHSINDAIPFSNIWIAKELCDKFPNNSVLYLGILNSLRSWNLFDTPNVVRDSCNVGGFGIDGGVSSFIGASLVGRADYYYAVTGDLAFFYDLNSLGNRHIGNNIRILVVNNGDGAEFILYHHYDDCFGEEVEKYIAAGGHYGRKSKSLVKHYAEDLGFKYICASNKDEFRKVSPEFMSTEKTCPILFEVFTDSQDESAALFEIDHLTNLSTKTVLKDSLKKSVRAIVGQKGIETIKGIINH